MTPSGERPETGSEKLERIIADVEEVLEAKVELPPEVIQANQRAYDWLKLDINLQQELKAGKIILPSREQYEVAQEKGYTTALIIPGQISRAELIETISTRYGQEPDLNEIHFWEQAKTDLNNTEAVNNPTKPNQLYLVHIKPEPEVDQAEPDTMGKTFPQCLELLDQRNQLDPSLKLKGLTLTEYFFSQALVTSQDSQQHLDTTTWIWLLGEVVKDDQGQFARCLSAGWGPGAARLVVRSHSASGHDSRGGARFAAVP
jgi:hypothetical protein